MYLENTRVKPPMIYPQRNVINDLDKITIDAQDKDAVIYYTINSELIPTSFSGTLVRNFSSSPFTVQS